MVNFFKPIDGYEGGFQPAENNRKVTSLTNSASRAKDIWEVVAWMGILAWRFVKPASNLTPLKELESLQGTVRKEPQELELFGCR